MTQAEDILNKLFTDFKQKLKNVGMSQQEAADELKITRSHLNKVINKRTAPSLKLIKDIENFCYEK